MERIPQRRVMLGMGSGYNTQTRPITMPVVQPQQPKK